MNKISFFRLPIIFAAIFWIMSQLSNAATFMIHGYELLKLSNYIIYNVINSLYLGLPEILLTLFISAIALYRCNIYLITLKNILYLALICLICNLILVLINVFIVSKIVIFFYEYIGYSMIVFSLKSFIINICICIIIGVVSYYSILSLQNVFDRHPTADMLNSSNSAKIHLILFMTLFVGIYSLFLVFLGYMYDGYSSYADVGVYAVINLVALAIFVSILYFSLRQRFMLVSEALQISRIIKSAVLSFIFSIIINIIIFLGMAIMVISIAFSSHYSSGEASIILVIVSGAILQLLLTCLIARAVCKRYFMISSNAT